MMKAEQLLEELEQVATKLEIKISYETLSRDRVSQGGLCRVHGQWRVIIDRHTAAPERIALLAQVLSGFNLDGVFLSPRARELVGAGLDTDADAETEAESDSDVETASSTDVSATAEAAAETSA